MNGGAFILEKKQVDRTLFCPYDSIIMILCRNKIHLYLVDINQYADQYNELFAMLDVDEKNRANKFKFDKDRRVFLISHGILRKILSSYLGCEAKKIQYAFGEHQKPYIKNHSLQFNLSHSGDRALIAVTQNDDIGVDIEKINSTIDSDALVDRFFFSR